MSPTARPIPSSGQSGSAYVTVLLVLLVLSTIAVSLVFVTTTEMRIGANERTVQRTLGAAEAGIGVALARMLVAADYSEGSYRINDEPDAAADGAIGSRVDLGPLLPLLEAPCNLCQVNDAGSYGSSSYTRVNVATTNRGLRGSGAVTVGERTVSAILDVQPVQVPTSAYRPLAENEPAELAQKVKF